MSTLEGFHGYRSPFQAFDIPERYTGLDFDRAVSALKSDQHFQWHSHRELYEQTGAEEALTEMLTYVTLDNPPLASAEEPDSDIRRWETLDTAYCTGILGVVLGFIFMFDGSTAVIAAATVFAVIAAVSWVMH